MAVPIDEPSQKPRIGFLDGFRAVAALYVLFHHTFCMAYPISFGEFPPSDLRVFWGVWTFGSAGVTAFIVLAGYSLALAIAKHRGNQPGGFWHYMKRRTMRIVPPYWIAILLTFVLTSTLIGEKSGTHWDHSLPTTTRDWVIDFFLLQDFATLPRNVAYTFWSVSVEYHIYLILPVVLLLRRFTNWYFAIAFPFAIAGILMLIQPNIPRTQKFFFEYYVLFLLGVAACVAVKNAEQTMRRVPWNYILVMLIVAMVYCGYEWKNLWQAEEYRAFSLLVGAAGVCTLVAMHVGQLRWLNRLLSSRLLRTIGGSSYTLYLIHAQLLAVVWIHVLLPMELSQPIELLVGWLIVAPMIVVIAWLASFVMEKPFLPKRGQG